MNNTLTRSLRRCSLHMLIAAVAAGLLSRDVAAVSARSGWTIFDKTRVNALQNMAALAAAEPYPASVFYNPALLGKLQTRTVQFTTELGFADDKMAGVYYAYPSEPQLSALLLGFSYYDAGPVELSWLTDADELLTRNVSLQRDALGVVSYGRRLGEAFYAGGSLKAASSEIAETRRATAVAVDAGLLYLPAPDITFSAALLNLGGATKFIDKEEALPATLSLGAGTCGSALGVSLYPAAVVNYDLVDENCSVEAGLRLGSEILGITMGYRSLADADALLLGFDLTVGAIEFGYSYSPGLELSASHRANITYRFSGTPLPVSQEKKKKPRSSSKKSSYSNDIWYQRQYRENNPWYK